MSTPNLYEAVNTLVERGWISLRQMAIILGMKELRGVYSRQKGKNRIETIRIGGIDRVYAAEVLKALQTMPVKYKDHADVVLSIYLTALREYNRKHKGDEDG